MFCIRRMYMDVEKEEYSFENLELNQNVKKKKNHDFHIRERSCIENISDRNKILLPFTLGVRITIFISSSLSLLWKSNFISITIHLKK